MSKFSPIILIVEDEALLSSTLKTKLEQDSSYHVVVVDNGQDVLEPQNGTSRSYPSDSPS